MAKTTPLTVSLLLLALTGCAGNRPAENTVDSDQTIPGGTVPSTHVTAGATLYIDGTELIVDGDLVVGTGGAIEGLAEYLVLVVRGNLIVYGDIRAPGHLALVSAIDLIPTKADLDRKDANSSMELIPGVGPVTDRDWDVLGSLQAGPGSTTHLTCVCDLTFKRAADASTPLLMKVASGADAPMTAGCNVNAGGGAAGGRIAVRTMGGTLRLEDVTFSGGNGGRGADLSGGPCPDGSSVTAGSGGDAGSFRFEAAQTSTSGFQISGTVVFDGFGGGAGGDASILGFDGSPGASVTANGGLGGLPTTLTDTTGLGFTFNLGTTGAAGNAEATGGTGLTGTCDTSGAGTPSFNGGAAVAVAGTGGTASAYGGRGGDGVDCTRVGGSGGFGGKGTANTDAFGGQGGHGGFGEDLGGLGGDGGEAIAPNATGGNAGDGGDAQGQGGDGGNGGCVGGAGGLGGAGFFPGAPGQAC